jgi:excisionase family DNA binding protein
VKVLSITEAAHVLSCSRGHVYNLIAAGELRVVDIGIDGRSKSRVYPEDLDAYIERHTRSVAS